MATDFESIANYFIYNGARRYYVGTQGWADSVLPRPPLGDTQVQAATTALLAGTIASQADAIALVQSATVTAGATEQQIWHLIDTGTP